MTKKRITHITGTFYRKIKKYIKKITASFGSEDIHQFRVTYKKLRAFLRMISEQNGNAGELKIPKKLFNCYHIFGSIRDLQLQQQNILKATEQKLIKPKAYYSFLQSEIDKLKLQLFKIFQKDPVTLSKEKTDKAIPAKFTVKKFRIYAKKKWDTVNAIIISGSFTNENMHAIRKNLKDLNYNTEEYKGFQNKFVSITGNKINKQYLNALVDELGNLQDKSAAVVLLKSYWLKKLNRYDQKLLTQIKTKWIKDKDLMKRILVTKLQTDFDIQITAH